MFIHRAFIYSQKNAPCLDCEKRHIGCHSECEEYKKYTEAIKQAKATVMEKYKGERAAENYAQVKLEKRKRRMWQTRRK